MKKNSIYENNILKIHRFLKENVSKNAVTADLTAGNGYDTKFLAENFAHVFSFDISEIAINNTKKLTKDFKNIDYFLADHADVLNYISIPLDIAIYNLGYLPKSDKKSITKTDTTLKSLDYIKEIINPNGYLVITTYLVHQGGYQEYLAVKNWLFNLNKPLIIYEYPTINSPVSFIACF